MKILDSLRGRSSGAPQDADDSVADGDLPIARYDKQDVGTINAQLPGLSQLELATIAEHEEANQARPEVLHKLTFMRQTEPVEGYDAMEATEVKEMLTEADTKTVRAVRDYERKFRKRPDVRAEAARVLPDSEANAQEIEAREAKTALIRETGRRS